MREPALCSLEEPGKVVGWEGGCCLEDSGVRVTGVVGLPAGPSAVSDGLGLLCGSRGSCILFGLWDLMLHGPERKVSGCRVRTLGVLPSLAEVRGCLVMKWLVRYRALWLGTWHLGRVLALISLSSPSFLMLVLTYRMGVMVFICLLKGFRSDVFNG